MLKLEHKVCSEQINPTLRAVVLEENSAQLPNEEELRLYAESLGINPDTEPKLLWIAREGISASLPKGWQVLQDENNQLFYYNTQTGMSLWEHPLDSRFRERVRLARCKLKSTGDDKENKLPSNSREQPAQTELISSPINRLSPSAHQSSTTSSRATAVQLVNGTGKQCASSPTVKEDWKNAPLLGEAFPGADDVRAGLVTPSGDATDTSTEYCNFVIPSLHSASSRRSTRLLGNASRVNQSPSDRMHQSTVGCQTQSGSYPETGSCVQPSSSTNASAVKHLADLDEADRRLTKLRDSIRRDYLLITANALAATNESSKCVSFSSKDHVLPVKPIPRSSTTNAPSAPAVNSAKVRLQQSETIKNCFDSPTPVHKCDLVICPTLGNSPSDSPIDHPLDERVLRQLQSIRENGDSLRSNTCMSPGTPDSTNKFSNYSEDPGSAWMSSILNQVPRRRLLSGNTGQRSSNCSAGTVVNVRHLVSPEIVQVACPAASAEFGPNRPSVEKPSERNQRHQSLLAVNDAFGHLLEERSRLERKLLRLRLIYKTYKQRMGNLDASINLLQKNTVSPVELAVDHHHRHRTVCADDSDDPNSEKRTPRVYRGQISILLADQVNELGGSARHKEDGQSPLCNSATGASPARSSFRSMSAPRHSTLLKDSVQSCSCCQSTKTSRTPAGTCACGYHSSLGLNTTTPLEHHLARMTLNCGRQRSGKDDPVLLMENSGNIQLLTSMSPERAVGAYCKPLLDASPTWQQSD